jgi:hypothetical protein
MSSDQIKTLTSFQNSLVTFFDELIEMFPNEADFVSIRIMIKDRIPITQVADFFCNKILPEKELVKNRDDRFFTERDTIFSLGPMKSNNFKNLWLSDKLGKDDRMTIWKWLDVFVFLSEKYSNGK